MNSQKIIVRPKLLSWLCIGSAIFGSLWIVMLITLIIVSILKPIPPRLFPGLAVGYLEAGFFFISAMIAMAVLGLSGVFMMWKQKIAGFFIYSVTKIILYFLPVVFIGYQHLTFPGLILTSIFILLYGTIFIKFFGNK